MRRIQNEKKLSGQYSWEKRSGKQFISNRAVKLLIPSTLWLFIYHWIIGYINIKVGGGIAYIPVRYPVLMVICYFLYYDCNYPVVMNYIIALVTEMVFTIIVFELLKRIPGIRYFVLGIKGGSKSKAEVDK